MIALRVRWVGQSDTGIAEDHELLSLAKLSGCAMLLIGFESLREESLSGINRTQWKLRQRGGYDTAVQLIQEHGIAVYAAFVVGFDEDDVSVFREIRDFMFANHCTGQFTILTPLPGSRLYDRLRAEGRLFRETYWDACNFFDIVFQPKKMTVDELIDGFTWLYDEVFSWDAVTQRAEYMKDVLRRLQRGGRVRT